ncbi:MAG TPA: hypothetical protein VFD43_00910 [Planctomycetota bacterium]|nr:hypothetical protein [Planctomycetota bacterium]
MTRTMLIATACLLAASLACSKDAAPPAKTGASAPAAGAATAAINASCPIMGNPIEANGGSVSFKGHAIGFCCPKCVPKFEALDDAGKVAALAKNGTKLPE